MRNNRRIVLGVTLLAAVAICSHAVVAREATDRPNVLFIAVDDLRPALGCYGDKMAVTPNIDRLAARSIVFNNAYCQQAVCSPSRLSMLCGLRPDTIEVWDLGTHFREAVPDAVTLPQHFKNHGYHSLSFGKIFHGGGKPAKDPPSWSVPPRFDVALEAKVRYALPKNLAGRGLKRDAAESADVDDNAYIDGIVCDAVVEAFSDLKAGGRPFFMAVGFRKPHLPFCAPRKYWELHDRDDIPMPVASEHPRGAPELAVRSWKELEGYADIPNDGRLSVEKVRELRHGYYACVSYVDVQVGRVLDELARLKLTENTVIVLWGDHGYHLGEQGLWTKANNYELSTRVPLMISVPGRTLPGKRTNALVELVDVYPTLADVCGLESPGRLEGVSLEPLLSEPDRPWKRAVFSQYPRSRKGSRHRRHGQVMGYAVRTDKHRYVRWVDWETKRVVAEELYDHRLDPNETRNMAELPEQAQATGDLAAILEAGWQAAKPRQ